MNKWHSIDDEIWAKLIVLERNRRVAKAYARAPVLTVNGSDDGFDGFRIGVAGFDNPMRDARTDDVIRHIGQVRLVHDRTGNGRPYGQSEARESRFCFLTRPRQSTLQKSCNPSFHHEP